MAEDNPITQVAKGLWTLLEASTEFTDLVPAKNRIKYVGSRRDPLLRRGAPNDYPMVRIVSVGTLQGVQLSSSHRQIVKTFAIEIANGDQRQDYLLTDVEWAVFRAMQDWQDTFESMTWDGVAFCKDADLREERDKLNHNELNHNELNRQNTGWTAVWMATITMTFPTTALIPD